MTILPGSRAAHRDLAVGLDACAVVASAWLWWRTSNPSALVIVVMATALLVHATVRWRGKRCRHCRGGDLVPALSDEGQELKRMGERDDVHASELQPPAFGLLLAAAVVTCAFPHSP